MPYGGGYSGLSSKNNRLTQSDFIKKSRKGAILIEFAFAVPVLFSLIYYVYDLAKMKRYNERMDFVGHQMAGMIQNISQNRADKRITKADLRNIISAAYTTIYPGDTQFLTPAGYPGPGFVHGKIFYVTCNSEG